MKLVNYVRNAGRPLCAPLAGFPGKIFTQSSVEENLHDGALQARTLIALHKAVNFDIVFPMMDLTVEAESFGSKINWNMDELPVVTEVRITTKEDADALMVPDIGKGNRLGVFVDTCRRLKEAFPNKPVWAYVLGPFSIAGRLMGMTQIAMNVKLEPEAVHAALRKTNDLLLKYSAALLDTGVDGLMVLEPAAGMLRADDANEFSSNYIREIIDLVKSRGKTPSLHNCGNIGHLIESLCATGIEALHVGSVTDPFEVYPRIPADVVLMGNLDPTNIFLRGTPETVEAAAGKLLSRMQGAGYDRFIISSGCDLPPGTPMENLRALEEVVRGARPCCSSCGSCGS
jgi:uroporphyrinogen decarboxylase